MNQIAMCLRTPLLELGLNIACFDLFFIVITV